MLEILSSRPNALSTFVENVVLNYREFFPEYFLNLAPDIVS